VSRDGAGNVASEAAVIIAAMVRTPRRAVAIATILVVAWTTLWPLVSAARAAFAHEPVKLCHQAGSMVDLGEAPAPMDPLAAREQGGKEGGTHCPLCIMAFYGSASPSLVIAPPQYSTHFVILAAYEAPRPAQHAPLLPQSRAPPFLIAS